jgi:hypothetical protein
MAKYRKKPIVIEALSFSELEDMATSGQIECTKNESGIPVFRYKGLKIVKNENVGYLIIAQEGVFEVKDTDMLIEDGSGVFYTCTKKSFDHDYEPVEFTHNHPLDKAFHQDCLVCIVSNEYNKEDLK